MYFDFKVDYGEYISIVGPSGGGKSTLLKLISGFLPISNGKLIICNTEHTHSPPNFRPVSMVFQENNLFWHLNVRQNIALGLSPNMRLNKKQIRLMREVTYQLGVTSLLDRMPDQISGGEKQLVAIARCLLRNRPILLLDEALSALDPVIRRNTTDVLCKLCMSYNTTLVMVSHSIEDVRRVTSRSLIVVDGTVYWDGQNKAMFSGIVQEAEVVGIKKKIF
jgi:thiamine transport system ATP-binding protein